MPNETFSAFCNRVQMAGKTCPFCECTKGCRAEEYAIGDQIVIGTTSNTIREKAMLKDWNLTDLRTNGTKHESAATCEVHIYKLGAYSYRELTDNSSQPRKPSNPVKKFHPCGMRFAVGHVKQYKAIYAKCSNC